MAIFLSRAYRTPSTESSRTETTQLSELESRVKNTFQKAFDPSSPSTIKKGQLQSLKSALALKPKGGETFHQRLEREKTVLSTKLAEKKQIERDYLGKSIRRNLLRGSTAHTDSLASELISGFTDLFKKNISAVSLEVMGLSDNLENVEKVQAFLGNEDFLALIQECRQLKGDLKEIKDRDVRSIVGAFLALPLPKLSKASPMTALADNIQRTFSGSFVTNCDYYLFQTSEMTSLMKTLPSLQGEAGSLPANIQTVLRQVQELKDLWNQSGMKYDPTIKNRGIHDCDAQIAVLGKVSVFLENNRDLIKQCRILQDVKPKAFEETMKMIPNELLKNVLLGILKLPEPAIEDEFEIVDIDPRELAAAAAADMPTTVANRPAAAKGKEAAPIATPTAAGGVDQRPEGDKINQSALELPSQNDFEMLDKYLSIKATEMKGKEPGDAIGDHML